LWSCRIADGCSARVDLISTTSDLDHETCVDHEVEPLHPDLRALVADRHAPLALDVMPSRAQLALQRRGVEVLEEAEAEDVVDLVEGADDGAGEAFFEEGLA
jgi:hypothetical protein